MWSIDFKKKKTEQRQILVTALGKELQTVRESLKKKLKQNKIILR